jgi:hypothetical protein
MLLVNSAVSVVECAFRGSGIYGRVTDLDLVQKKYSGVNPLDCVWCDVQCAADAATE